MKYIEHSLEVRYIQFLSVYQFKVGSDLWLYLKNRRPTFRKRRFTLKELLTEFHSFFKTNKHLLDPTNPYMIICDEKLKNLFNARVFHISQLGEQLAEKLVLVEKYTGFNPITEKALNSKPILPLASVTPSTNSVISDPRQPIFLKALFNTDLNSNPNCKFIPSDKLRTLFKSLSGFDNSKACFTGKEIGNYFKTYIIEEGLKLVDLTNTCCFIVKDTPLGQALGVNTFHKSQLNSYLSKNLTPCLDLSKLLPGVEFIKQ